MNKIDDLIGRALTEEDRALLASHAEPGYLKQATRLFRGPMASTMWLVYIVAGLCFVAAVYACWHMLGATESLLAFKWGIGSLLLFQIAIMCKSFMGSHLEANRVMRELKRLELQVAMMRSQSDRK